MQSPAEMIDQLHCAMSVQSAVTSEPPQMDRNAILLQRAAALIASQAARIAELETVYDAARGLCYGEDWNNGTHAKTRGYRQKLVAAVNAIEPLPSSATLKGETP